MSVQIPSGQLQYSRVQRKPDAYFDVGDGDALVFFFFLLTANRLVVSLWRNVMHLIRTGRPSRPPP